MSKNTGILVVDDEKNIRMTMVHALESRGYHVESAMSGQEALLMLQASPFDLVFLDLKMPGLDGMQVLRKTRAAWPAVRVIIITAHGSIDTAVEAMKLGAADFIQKPFTAAEIRELADSALDPPPPSTHASGYEECLVEARQALRDKQIAPAAARVRHAISLDPARPEAFNLLGVAAHLMGQRYKAQSYFRAAIALDPTYVPADRNLEQSVSGGVRGTHVDVDLGDGAKS